MSLPVSGLTNTQTYQLLRKAGLSLSQIPKAWLLMRDTVDQWLHQKLEQENVQQVSQLLKSKLQENGPQLVLDQLKDVLIGKLIVRLGVRSALAGNIVTLVLPILLERAWKVAQRNPKVQAWWKEQQWSEKLPTTDDLTTKVQQLRSKFRNKPTTEEDTLFV